MTEFEGYAQYIQTDFLQKHYNIATFFPHYSAFQVVIYRIIKMFIPEFDKFFKVKLDQYSEGLEKYRKRQSHKHPTDFILP